MRLAAALAALVLAATPALAGPTDLPLRAPIAYDGDTLFVTIPDLPPELRRLSVRVLGVDTPEIRGRCDSETALAVRARNRVRAIFAGCATVRVDIEGWDKYGGRIDARVSTPDGEDLAVLLIREGLGRRYDGGKRAGWCPIVK